MIAAAAWRQALWLATGQALTAHVVMLRDVAILDDASAAAVLNTVDAIRRGEPPETESSLTLVATFDERFDSQSAAAVAGAARIARARHDLAATAQRLALRDLALDLADSRAAAQGAVIDLAEDHVFTLMNAWSGSAPLQPTNLAHVLSGVIAPLGRAGSRLQAAYSDLDRSPMGAGALAGPGFPVDREEAAELLGTEGPVESTFDALSAVDHLDAVAGSAMAIVAPPRRLLDELLLWLRTEPGSLRLADELLARPDANLPHFRPPAALERIVSEAEAVENLAAAINRATSHVRLGPVGDSTDRAAEQTAIALSRAAGVCAALATMLSGPIEINRAWLARGAGRDLVTSGDLADFLLTQETLDPVSARDIASLTAQRARQDGLEASAITPALIDSAALLVIGRELGIELERLGGFLAPRRFIEKRTLLGGPAAPAVREYLQTERERLQDNLRWIAETRARIEMAAENVDIRCHEIFASASTG